jgi:two-component system phosphate regulon response regulator OmpR
MIDTQPHILIVDDDRRLRELLRKFLSENDYMVTTANNAAAARARMESLAFDLLVLDVMMPGETGLDLTRSLRRTSPVPILLLTAMGDADDRIAGLECGADDYLAKPFEPRELLLRVGSILRRAGPPAAPAATVAFGEFAFDIGRAELTRAGQPVRLTTGEADLLKVFALNPGTTLTRERLGREGGLDANQRTVDVQIARLRRKIEADPKAPRYLQTVWGAGYVLRAE